jgi:hypothetical protein
LARRLAQGPTKDKDRVEAVLVVLEVPEEVAVVRAVVEAGVVVPAAALAAVAAVPASATTFPLACRF